MRAVFRELDTAIEGSLTSSGLSRPDLAGSPAGALLDSYGRAKAGADLIAARTSAEQLTRTLASEEVLTRVLEAKLARIQATLSRSVGSTPAGELRRIELRYLELAPRVRRGLTVREYRDLATQCAALERDLPRARAPQ